GFTGHACRPHEKSGLTFLKNHSEAVPKITKYFTLLFLTWGLVEAAPVYLKNANTFWEFTQTSIPIIFISYLIINFSISLGKLIENSLDNTEPPSYICITRGDTKAAIEANNANKGELIKAAITGTISSTFGVLTKYTTALFGFIS
ncbi:MAG: hypothetical protein K2Y24_12055, partial [Pseudomonadaceae bacterium]|nr:hypothetical protein [Pseudomonadaceae bacterium]